MNEKDDIRLLHILDSGKELLELSKQFSDMKIFSGNRLFVHSSIRLLEIIGEAIGVLSPEFKEKYPDLDWKSWKDLRNILIHQYFGIDEGRIFLVIKEEIPILIEEIMKIISSGKS